MFRLKLSRLSSPFTFEELKRHLPEIDVSCLKFSPNLGERNVVYLVAQTSANFLRKVMRRFPQFECQLETNERLLRLGSSGGDLSTSQKGQCSFQTGSLVQTSEQ